MTHTIPDDELADIQVAAHDNIGRMPGMGNAGPWILDKVMESFMAGAKYQYQEERNRKAKKSKIPVAAWFAIIACIFIVAMPLSRNNTEMTCYFMLSVMFAGMMALAWLIEEKDFR